VRNFVRCAAFRLYRGRVPSASRLEVPYMQTRELYRSPNGDRWSLVRETATSRVLIRHEPNLPSGGRPTLLDVGRFLRREGQGPEHQALLQLIGSLLDESSMQPATKKEPD
jgi:hypothetical protein